MLFSKYATALGFGKRLSQKQPVIRTDDRTVRIQRENLIDVRNLIRTRTPEQLKYSADAYFATISDPAYHLAKPFSSLDECPILILQFAKIIQGGAFVAGQKVLEFGAGSCWAGRFLNQLGLEVISLDISPSALKIGAHLKNAWKVFGNQPEHTFLEFDGTRIDLPDASIDRIVCFDCFHHVANPEHVLREFFRVLKPNGLVAFSEPGPSHSLTAQSQEEMRNYQVIENDIVIDEIWAMGQKIGYANICFSLVSIEPVVLDFSGFQSFRKNGMAADTLSEIKTNIEQHHENATTFFLVKGKTDEKDSRTRAGLVADIKLTDHQDVLDETGKRFLQVSFEIKNPSKSCWLRSGPAVGNVNLGAHLFNEQGKLLDYDFYRFVFLRQKFQPAATTAFTCLVPWPDEMESFVLEFDLVSEQVCWFALNGSKTEKLMRK
jgi:SAM-dependent methyltransferase